MDVYRRIAKMLLWAAQAITLQRRCVSGREHLPAGARIIAANHINPTDAYHLPFVLEGKFYTLMAEINFSLPFTGWLMTQCDQIPVCNARKHVAFDRACELLRRGETILIFPEGRLNPDHLPIKAHTGAVRMSLASHAPIIPVGIYVPACFLYTRLVPRDGCVEKHRYQIGGCCYIHIGEPWYPGRESGPQPGACDPHKLTEILMHKIDLLANQARQAAAQDELSRLRGGAIQGNNRRA